MLSRRAAGLYWALFVLWQGAGFWLIFGPLVIASQAHHENAGVDVLLPGSFVSAMTLLGTGMPQQQGLQLASFITLAVNALLAFGVWRLLLWHQARQRRDINPTEKHATETINPC